MDSGLWLADTYEGLPDFQVGARPESTSPPIDSDWKSPFIGKSIEDAANFVRNTPKPPKPLNRTWFAVLQKELFKESRELLICKILPVGGESDLEENEEDATEEFRKSGMSLMCKIYSDKQQKIHEESIKGEDKGEFEAQMQNLGVGDSGEAEDKFEVQTKTMKVGSLGAWRGQDDAHYWWLN